MGKEGIARIDHSHMLYMVAEYGQPAISFAQAVEQRKAALQPQGIIDLDDARFVFQSDRKLRIDKRNGKNPDLPTTDPLMKKLETPLIVNCEVYKIPKPLNLATQDQIAQMIMFPKDTAKERVAQWQVLRDLGFSDFLPKDCLLYEVAGESNKLAVIFPEARSSEETIFDYGSMEDEDPRTCPLLQEWENEILNLNRQLNTGKTSAEVLLTIEQIRDPELRAAARQVYETSLKESGYKDNIPFPYVDPLFEKQLKKLHLLLEKYQLSYSSTNLNFKIKKTDDPTRELRFHRKVEIRIFD